MTHFKFVVEQHPDGFVAYPLGMLGVVVGEGNTADEALADAKSAAKFHIDTFGAAATAENQNRIIRQLPDDDGVV